MSRRAPAPAPVALVSRWTGFCLPCDNADRPLVLTWSGRRGIRAWWAGDGWHEGRLSLTCVCCGGVDPVGWDDEPVAGATGSESVPVADADVVATLPSPRPAVTVVRVLDLDTAPPTSTVPAEHLPAQHLPSGSADADALDLLRLVG